MKCPYCELENTKTIETRSMDFYVRRRRICNGCNKRFTTLEYSYLPNPAGVTGHGIHKKHLKKAISLARGKK